MNDSRLIRILQCGKLRAYGVTVACGAAEGELAVESDSTGDSSYFAKAKKKGCADRRGLTPAEGFDLWMVRGTETVRPATIEPGKP